MKKHGFTLVEILVALCLIATTCLALLKQQWHSLKWANEQLLTWQANQHLKSACERQKAGLPRQKLRSPFHWHASNSLGIEWQYQQKRTHHQIDCAKR